MYRNTPHGKPQWSRPVLSGHDSRKTSYGSSFLGEAPKRPFDANRYINWRYFWDYSGGNVYENMCHQVSFWYRAMNLQIPKAVTMTGGMYLWKDGREVPDTMNVSMEQPEEILFSWDSGFGNNSLGGQRRRAGHRRDHLRRRADPLHAAEGEPARRRQEMHGRTTAASDRAHAELPRLHPLGQSSPTARSRSASAPPSRAAWRWTATGRAERSAGTRIPKRSSRRRGAL